MIDRSEQGILAPLNLADRNKFLELASRLVHVNNVYSRAPMNLELIEGSERKPTPTRSTAGAKRKQWIHPGCALN